MRKPAQALEDLWARHHAEWRDTAQIASAWSDAADTDPALLRHRVRGAFWETLAEAGITLLVTREYEHLLMALHACNGRPTVTFLRLPHPSGLAVDRKHRVVYVASTRNPNQVLDLVPVSGSVERLDTGPTEDLGNPLVPVRSRFFPGSLYIHDLAIVGEGLHANAVGHNAVVRLAADGGWERVWWPRCIESGGAPVFGANVLQLNSIAAGRDLAQSFYSASTDRPSRRRPGHRNFAVDGRGVIFSGTTREPVARGLTRPHSARLRRGAVFVANSGYGELVVAAGGRYEALTRLPGWTRGLAFHRELAFVGTSRVIPRFRQYAPGLDMERTECGVHVVDVPRGEILGSLVWPQGNQIFAIDWLPLDVTTGFPFRADGPRATAKERKLFYAFETRRASRRLRPREGE